jgi:tetratricopeptide (TPR) repeat protein
VLRKQGDEFYLKGDYRQSLTYYSTLKQYEIPPSIQTIERIATAQYYLGDFNAALRSLKHMHNQTPNDLQLIYQIGEINLLHLKNYKEAEQYFALGKKQLKKNLVSVYGDAYEVVMNPKDVPDLYYIIFESSAKTNLALGDYEEVVKDCDWASYLRPERAEPDSLLQQAEALK